MCIRKNRESTRENICNVERNSLTPTHTDTHISFLMQTAIVRICFDEKSCRLMADRAKAIITKKIIHIFL